MERTCRDNEHEFKWSNIIKEAEVCTHCGLLRIASEIDHDYFEDWHDDDDADSDYIEDEDDYE